MSQIKVFFIILDSVADAKCSPVLLQELEKFSNMLKNIEGDFLIVTSPVYECLQSSETLSNSLKADWCVLRELSLSDVLFFDNDQGSYSVLPPLDAEFYPISVESVKHIARMYKQNLIIVVENQVFINLGVQGKTRTGNGVNLCQIDMDENLKDENRVPKASQNEGKVSFRACLRIDIIEKLDFFLQRIQRVFEKLKKAANKVDQAGEEILDMLEVTESDESNYNNQLIATSNTLKKAENVYKKLESTIKNFENLALTPIDVTAFKDQVKICKFVYDFFSGSWILTIKNSSPFKIPNLSVYCLESNEKIHTFKALQGNCKASASLIIPNPDFYYKNLFAAVSGTVVSTTFKIFPFRLSVLNISEDQGIWLKVENCSIHPYSHVSVANSSSRRVFKLSAPVDYKTKIFERVNLNITEDTTVFLVSENRCVSNPIALSSDNLDN